MKYLDSKHQVIDDTEIEAKAVVSMAQDKQKQALKKEYASFKLYTGKKGPKKKVKKRKILRKSQTRKRMKRKRMKRIKRELRG
ncbi:hypothetical protein HOB10_05035 [Candidatus Parcubacteria bacterium]|jgi:hypothetical protein|nr:hypothetical protein [Candidatus Parcubacteria bacterium]